MTPKRKLQLIIVSAMALVLVLNILLGMYLSQSRQGKTEQKIEEKYWFVLHRTSNKEDLFLGKPGNKGQSRLIKTFTVKVGIPNERPTPLPQLLGREYWVMTQKEDKKGDPEVAPYFLTLNVPAPSEAPYGPVPYEECNGQQCDWVRPGPFGLHGINGDPSRLGPSDPGSSGCIRHRDEDITYLYNLLDPKKQEIRYYIEEN